MLQGSKNLPVTQNTGSAMHQPVFLILITCIQRAEYPAAPDFCINHTDYFRGYIANLLLLLSLTVSQAVLLTLFPKRNSLRN